MASAAINARHSALYMEAVGEFQKVLTEGDPASSTVWDRTVCQCLLLEHGNSGVQGLIYKCSDSEQRLRTIKLPKRNHILIKDLVKELRVLRICRGNEGIIQLVYAGCVTPPARPYLVMEWCPFNLWQRLQRNNVESFPLKERLQTVEQIAAAVTWLNVQAGYVHSDLQSRNILVTESGRPKLADFGLSFPLFEPPINRCLAYAPDGYIAAERFVESTYLPATQAVDVYGIGIILLELLSRTTNHPYVKDQISVSCGWYMRNQASTINPIYLVNKRISVLEEGAPGVTPLLFPEAQQPVVKSVWHDLIVHNLDFVPENRCSSVKEQATELQKQIAKLTPDEPSGDVYGKRS